MTQAKRHHFVPKFYLDRFAVADTVVVKSRTGTLFSAGTLNVAVESGFYDYTMPDGSKSKTIEERLSTYETAAAAIFR